MAYFDRMEGKPPRKTLLGALDRFGDIDAADPPLLVDLACGAGRDSAAALERGWRVWAQDGHADGIRRLREREDCRAALASGHLETVACDFAAVEIPVCSILNASFSLPFCPPADWPGLWRKIDAAIPSGGRFAGQMFGERDGWALLEDRTHLTRVQVLDLFSEYVIESFEEEDRPGTHSGDLHKHWHVFHIIARKR